MKCLDWEPAFPTTDVPFIPGVRVRIHEAKPIAWDDNPRRLFKIWIGDRTHSAVLSVKYPEREIMTCSDHDDDCDCRMVARKYMEQTQ